MAELTGRFSWITDEEHLVIEGVLPVERLVRAAQRTKRLTQSTRPFAPLRGANVGITC